MPRLRFIAKVLCSFIFLIVLFKDLGQHAASPPPPPDQAPPPQPPEEIPDPREEWKEPTEEEMIEMAKREEWIWKDFDQYVACQRFTAWVLSSHL